jgi:glutamate transport system ATP-binding protein
MVFQSFNLFAHKTILENVTLGPIKVKGVSKAEADKEAMALLERVGVGPPGAQAARPSSPAASSSVWPSHAPSP